MIVYKDLQIQSSSITYFKRKLWSIIYKKFHGYFPDNQNKQTHPTHIKYMGNVISIAFMSLFMISFEPRVYENILAKYMGQIESKTMSNDLSFYNQFGYTHNYTFEFYSTADGNVHYEVFVNNEKD